LKKSTRPSRWPIRCKRRHKSKTSASKKHAQIQRHAQDISTRKLRRKIRKKDPPITQKDLRASERKPCRRKEDQGGQAPPNPPRMGGVS
jgi:hypothetical protein